ncbi:hypothetical protein Nepgr_021739 [Nepenthes gracilis]|uniref:Uncharacterized protein n=1 Tax=Nepenthes gracilis TaxID=150966 RepID=A0AAD3SZ03_NEPGR|nr:hypothetical protein Nepgr_021739 [Nepenthes gracilis]
MPPCRTELPGAIEEVKYKAAGSSSKTSSDARNGDTSPLAHDIASVIGNLRMETDKYLSDVSRPISSLVAVRSADDGADGLCDRLMKPAKLGVCSARCGSMKTT